LPSRILQQHDDEKDQKAHEDAGELQGQGPVRRQLR